MASWMLAVACIVAFVAVAPANGRFFSPGGIHSTLLTMNNAGGPSNTGGSIVPPPPPPPPNGNMGDMCGFIKMAACDTDKQWPCMKPDERFLGCFDNATQDSINAAWANYQDGNNCSVEQDATREIIMNSFFADVRAKAQELNASTDVMNVINGGIALMQQVSQLSPDDKKILKDTFMSFFGGFGGMGGGHHGWNGDDDNDNKPWSNHGPSNGGHGPSTGGHGPSPGNFGGNNNHGGNHHGNRRRRR